MNKPPWLEALEFAAHVAMGAIATSLYCVHPVASHAAWCAIAYREGWQREPAPERPWDPYVDWAGYVAGGVLIAGLFVR